MPPSIRGHSCPRIDINDAIDSSKHGLLLQVGLLSVVVFRSLCGHGVDTTRASFYPDSYQRGEARVGIPTQND